MIVKYGITVSFIFFTFRIYAQHGALIAGEKLPVNTIFNICNDRQDSLRIPDPGKSIILDFGSLNCHGCVAGLPVLNSLQLKFKDSLHILWVTTDDKDKIYKFISGSKVGKEIGLAILASDTTLNNLFPHKEIPYEVWIDDKGYVKAFTDSKYVDSLHIEDLIQSRRVDWPLEREVKFDSKKGDLMSWNILLQDLTLPKQAYNTLFTDHFVGLKSVSLSVVDSSQNLVTYRMLNLPILYFYFSQFKDSIPFPFDYSDAPVFYDIRVKNMDTRLYNASKDYDINWARSNTFCYETTLPLAMSEINRRRRIISDLNFYFKLNGRIERRLEICRVLRVKADLSHDVKLNVKGVVSRGTTMSVGELKHLLNSNVHFKPFLDESGYLAKDEYGMKFNIDKNALDDIVRLNDALTRFGLVIIEERRLIPIFVLTDD